MLEIGSVVDGKYKILNKIGQGGMSVVYLAMNEKANKQWAIKEVRKDGIQNYEVIKQGLVVETDMLKRLEHPNLPSIIDVIDGDGTFLIVMDYIEGNTLSSALKEDGVLPQEYVIEWAKQLCDVLGYLHSRKPPIIYRDMKPSNVMLKPDGNVILIDFGTAREFKESSVADTTCLGTQGYAAPEQFGGQGQTDARTDIYCLGATLYHLLTGHDPCQPPYEMAPIRQYNRNLSTGLEKIIWKCIQKNPDDRYQTCAELYYALEHYDQLDSEYRAAQKKKLTAFVTTATLTVLLGIGSIFGYKMEEKTRNSSYEAYLREAKSVSDRETAIENYTNAISIDPTREEAYISLIYNFVDNDDRILTQDEDAVIQKILSSSSNGRRRTNKEYLQSNEAGYVEFSYKLGITYYYFYNGTGHKPYSIQWFQNVVESNVQTEEIEQQKLRSNIYGKIADYYLRIGKGNEAGDASIKHADYWEDLMELYTMDMQEIIDLDNEITALRLYDEIVYQVYTNYNKFQKENIDFQQMLSVLEEITERVDQIRISDNTDASNLISTIKENSAEAIYRIQELEKNNVLNTQGEG